MVVKIVELLSPVKDNAALISAIKNGADSVYVGVHGYNMRANIANFSIHDLEDLVDICHDYGVKLYVCTNTVMKNSDINVLRELMPIIKSSGADAVIASDLGALKIARENEMDVHMSVQANLSNTEALNVLHELGVTRVILSRELSIVEIKEIAENTDMEIEVFVHGAMCVAISGRCFLSSYLYGKSANCGKCLQPCRKEWKLISEEDEELILRQDFEGETNVEFEDILYSAGDCTGFKSDKTHIFSPKDLCMVEHIPELIGSGVHAFKIEGRARPADYVATVTKVYREAIDEFENGLWNSDHHGERSEKWKIELGKVFNRGFDTGFFFKTPHKTSSSNQATCIKKDIGEVVNYYGKVNAAEIRLWGDLNVGDELVIQGNTTGSTVHMVKSMQINGKNIEKASKGKNVAVLTNEKVRPKDTVYKRIKKNQGNF